MPWFDIMEAGTRRGRVYAENLESLQVNMLEGQVAVETDSPFEPSNPLMPSAPDETSQAE